MKPSKLQKLLALSGSSNEHEATNAAVMLAKGLREAGVDLEKALQRRGPDPYPISSAASRWKNANQAKRQADAEARAQAARAKARTAANRASEYEKKRQQMDEEWQAWAWEAWQ